ncbi:MAG: hypothetical protein ACTSU2_05280 [Promethearchaeota archaeon]
MKKLLQEDIYRIDVDLTDNHLKLLYLISKYTYSAKDIFEKDIWIKEFPLLTLIFEGILNSTFDYDYAPMSIELHGRRRILNISQDAIDDLEDLREMKLIECLKLSHSNFRLTSAYKIRDLALGIEVPEEFKKQINELTSCPKCGHLLETELDPTGNENLIYIVCKNPECMFRTISEITEIEEVSYSTEPYFPVIPVLLGEGEFKGLKTMLEIPFRSILEARAKLFKEHYQRKIEGFSFKEKEALKPREDNESKKKTLKNKNKESKKKTIGGE